MRRRLGRRLAREIERAGSTFDDRVFDAEREASFPAPCASGDARFVLREPSGDQRFLDVTLGHPGRVEALGELIRRLLFAWLDAHGKRRLPRMTHEVLAEALEDDDARLVAADALEERGDPRGEYLRLELNLRRLLPAPPSRVW